MGRSLPGRIVFMGTPPFARTSLQALLEAGAVPVAVFTRPDRPAGRGRHLAAPPVKELALLHGIPVHQPETLKDPAVRSALDELVPDVIVVVAYGRILPRAVLELPRWGCVNVHASLLPRHRGASPITHAIWAGDEQAGVCTMRMDAGLDTGPVYLRRAIPMPRGATTGTLTPLLADLGAHLLVETLEGLVAETLVPEPQDDSLATLAPRLTPESGRLNFTRGAEELERQVRAFLPWPGTYFEFGGERVKVLSAIPGPAVSGCPPGEVVEGPALAVACGDGRTLYLSELQRAGKRPLPSSEVLRGFPIPAKVRL